MLREDCNVTTSLIVIVSCTLFLLFIVVEISRRKRGTISKMTGMMAAMTVGMSVGLMVGTILGILYSENLFLSTVIGMIIGLFVGGIAGITFNAHAVLEGILSGAMGGMMGAMLGVMVAPEYRDSIIKVIFVLMICCNLMMIYIIGMETDKGKASLLMRLFNNPLIMMIAVLSFFYFFDQLEPVIKESNSANNNSHQNHNPVESTERSNQTKEIIVKAGDFYYEPKKITISKNEEVTIKLINEGVQEHDLEVETLNALDIGNNTSHNHSGEKIHLHANPDEEAILTFKPLESGTYKFYCTLPGHKESGMMGSLEVL